MIERRRKKMLDVDPDHPPEVGTFSTDQEHYVEFHRAEIFRTARG